MQSGLKARGGLLMYAMRTPDPRYHHHSITHLRLLSRDSTVLQSPMTIPTTRHVWPDTSLQPCKGTRTNLTVDHRSRAVLVRAQSFLLLLYTDSVSAMLDSTIRLRRRSGAIFVIKDLHANTTTRCIYKPTTPIARGHTSATTKTAEGVSSEHWT